MTQAFNLALLANNLNTSGQLDASDGLVNAVPVANGGTGQTSLTSGSLVAGNGTSAVSLIAPSTSGNVLTSNGTAWVSAAAPSSAPTTAQVLSATAGASVGAVGTYAWLGSVQVPNPTYTAGSTAAGSNLRYAGMISGAWSASTYPSGMGRGASGTPSGTWRCMGVAVAGNFDGSYVAGATLWLRIS